MHFKDYIKTYKDFPKPGIDFKDIMPILWHPDAFAQCIEMLIDAAKSWTFDAIVGIESRGFLFATPLALALKKPFIPLRKAGKLPGEVIKQGYELEYGEAHLEMQTNLIKPDTRVLLFDDFLATGGTLLAGCQLVEKAGSQVAGCLVLLELMALKGRETLAKYPLHSLVRID